MKYHIISLRDLKKLIKDGHVYFNEDTESYNYHEGMPHYLSISGDSMLDDIIASRRRSFEYAEDLENKYADDPFIDGISGDYGTWFVPIWCVVEWLKKRGTL